MSTFLPAWYLVPRWRMMMLPGTTVWPPNFLTPRRRPRESRPLREEPPAFLCAIVVSPLLAGLDAGDAQHGERLAVPVLAAVVVPPLLLEDEHLVAAYLLDDLGRDGGAAGAALGIGALADHEHAVESHLCPRLAGELLDGDEVVLGNLVLLAAGADDCEHDGRFAL